MTVWGGRLELVGITLDCHYIEASTGKIHAARIDSVWFTLLLRTGILFLRVISRKIVASAQLAYVHTEGLLNVPVTYLFIELVVAGSLWFSDSFQPGRYLWARLPYPVVWVF